MKQSLALVLFGTAAFAAELAPVPIWPGAAPGSENATQQEQITGGGAQGIRRVSNVTRPTLTPFLPEASKANGTAIVVCPGGGFRILAIDHEGYDVARWLNSLGVAAFVLKYRLVQTGDAGEKDRATMEARRKTTVPLSVADGQQAIRLVRSHAAEWHIAPDRIGIMGFSAGGYVTAAVALQHTADSRPNFAAPIYPGVPEDVTVPADAGPLFLALADDDHTVPPVKNGVRLYTAWNQAHVPAELHIYSKGGHGFGMRRDGLPVSDWTGRLHDWLDVQGLLKPVH